MGNKNGPDVFEALQLLPEEQRLPALLHYFHGYPVRDVSEILGIHVGLVQSRLRTARKKLKTLLAEGRDRCE